MFFLSFAILLLTAFYFTTNATNFRGENAVRFDKMSRSELVATTGLSRTQSVYLKLGYIERTTAPDIAVLGNHQVQYFSERAFGALDSNIRFFNLWGAASTLNDNFAYARLLEKLGILPKLLIVHITTPNNDNGGAILGHNPNMFAVLWQSGLVTSNENLLTAGKQLFNGLRLRVSETLDYISLVGALSNRLGAVVVDREKCMAAIGSDDADKSRWWIRFLPNTIKHIFSSKEEMLAGFCQPKYLKVGFLRDGSNLPPENHKPPVLNRAKMDPLSRKLTRDSTAEIAGAMHDLIALAERNNIKLVFLIPPVYETARESLSDEIFSNALREVPGKYVMDDRYAGHGHPEIFVDYDHPNNSYFETVTERLRKRGLIPEE